MGVTTLDSYDFLGTGDGIELRSGEVEWMCGARVIEWSIRCYNDVADNVQVVKVQMFDS